ncbi:MAG: hypothetical protein QOJ40_1804 [Verrucomicrobiota bacterium]
MPEMRIVFKQPIKLLILLLLLQSVGGCVAPGWRADRERSARAAIIKGTQGTYCQAPRTSKGRVDIERLVAELVETHANTYCFCIHGWATDWDDLQLLLPRARAKGIRIWASIVPPSESPPRTAMYAEPFRLDYKLWAIEFAKLSVREPNLVAWSIDDFTHNLKIYTPVYVREMLAASHRINPKLAFVPCSYFPSITAKFVTNYCAQLDGILFPYRHESAGANLKDPSLVEAEVKYIKAHVGR